MLDQAQDSDAETASLPLQVILLWSKSADKAFLLQTFFDAEIARPIHTENSISRYCDIR